MDKHAKSKTNWLKHVGIAAIIFVIIMIVSIAIAPKQALAAVTSTNPIVEAAKEATPAKWDVEAVYAKIENGMTKPQVEMVAGKTSDTCTETTNEYTGKLEMCSYGNTFIDKAMIMVTYTQDAVSGKTKSKY